MIELFTIYKNGIKYAVFKSKNKTFYGIDINNKTEYMARTFDHIKDYLLKNYNIKLDFNI